MDDGLVIILTSLDDPVRAQLMARSMVESRLAACVQITSGADSTYRWQNKTESTTEQHLVIKTTTCRLEDTLAWLRKHHPYDIPELVWWQVNSDAPYTAWAKECVATRREQEL